MPLRVETNGRVQGLKECIGRGSCWDCQSQELQGCVSCVGVGWASCCALDCTPCPFVQIIARPNCNTNLKPNTLNYGMRPTYSKLLRNSPLVPCATYIHPPSNNLLICSNSLSNVPICNLTTSACFY